MILLGAILISTVVVGLIFIIILYLGFSQPEFPGFPADVPDTLEFQTPSVEGETLSLAGSRKGLELEVTLERVHDPVEPRGRHDGPTPGMRFLVVRLTLRNEGSVSYRGVGTKNAYLIDDQGRQVAVRAWDVKGYGCDGQVSARIAPRESSRMCLLFLLSDDLAAELFWLDLPGLERGEWVVLSQVDGDL